MKSLASQRRGVCDDTDALHMGLASLRLGSECARSSFDADRKDREIVASALVFALELDTPAEHEDTRILDDRLELEARVRDKLLPTMRGELTEHPDVARGGPLQSFLRDTDDTHGNPVDLIVEKGECSISGASLAAHTVLGTGSFSSVRADCCVGQQGGSTGAYAFEVQLHTSGIMQVGWVTENTKYTSEDGVGDSKDSYAYDGKRVRKWNVQSVPYGEQWTAGDVIGCCVDLDVGEVRYFRNGKDLGIAFGGLSLGMGLFPAVSLSYGESCEINLGRVRFQYEYDGFESVVVPSSGTIRLERSAKYVFDSLERLTIVGQAKNRSSPRAAAAIAAIQAEEYFGIDEDDDEERLAYRESIKEPSPCDVLMSQAQEDAARALVRQADAVFRNEFLVDSLFMEACRRMNDYDYSGQALYRFLDIVAKGIGDDAELLGMVARIACHHATRRVMGNIWHTRDDPECCEAIVCSFIWQGFMKTQPFARAWVAERDPLSGRWEAEFELFFFVRQPTNQDMAELVPTSAEGDIEQVVNTLVYAGDGDITAEGSDTSLVGIVGDINRFLNMTDDVHAILMEQLMEIDDKDLFISGSRLSSGQTSAQSGEAHVDADAKGSFEQCTIDEEDFEPSPSDLDDYLEYFRANQVTLVPRNEWVKIVLDVMAFEEDPTRGFLNKKPPPKLLRAFLRFFAKKNMEVNREVVPPGVSDRSITCSLLSFMVRASRRFLRDVHLEGAEFEFPMQVFLRGIRSVISGRDDLGDNLAVDARVGGSVSYLCKSSIVEACNRVQKPLLVPAVGHEHASDWSIPMEMRPRAVFIDGTPEWSWWILNQCFLLFHLGGRQNIKKITTFMSTFEAAMTTFKGLLEKLEEGNAGSDDRVSNDRELIEYSMKECRNTMMTSLRMLMWYLNWLMPRWKQQTYNVLAGTMARVLLAMQRDEDAPQVSYVADFYIEGVLDMVLACRGRETTAFAFEGDCLHCFESFLELCVQYITDPRVVSPHVQNAVLNAIWMILRDEDTSYFIGRSSYARAHLFPALVAQFDHPRNWIHASNAFHLLVQYNGVAQRAEVELDTRGLVANRVAIQNNLKHALQTDRCLAARLFSTLIDRLNWVSPELIVILEELHQQVRSRRGGERRELDGFFDNISMNYRRALAACDLTYHLLRLLELACQANPTVFLDTSTSESQLLTTRLAELVGWALLNFGQGSHAYAMSGDIHIYGLAGGIRLGPEVRPSMIAELLGPYMGILVALYEGSKTRRDPSLGLVLKPSSDVEPEDERTRDGFDSFIEQIHDMGITDEIVQDCLNVVMQEELSGLRPMTPHELSSVHACIQVLKMNAECRNTAKIEPPEDFMDPILNVLMSDPVILPSGVRLDRKTIQRHLANSATDPYTQQQLKEEDLVDDVELRKKVQAWSGANRHQRP